ncbi:flagellar filament capping protein FliD [Thiomicrorhabdus heinhorstiae]|uniref:Flagellar hook-associated protein 2 n=1 Tax=Thiomicrorhabdus heinhorstiae TaxID=2748010 RepID=A0ABS0BZA3_9GAMM|nr:flagellar filament capping protein FliD [Thiomicrorhabdus heinhorstiae]MBF6058388.1 flagellar filament capping protein FliD [Thiomicrorhabdus heinhorstiae]
MANEIGTTLLNSLTGSTFDIGNMAKVLAEAEVAGPKAILENNQEKVTTELDALKYLQSNLNAFNTYVNALSSPDLFSQKTASSSNSDIVSVTASSSANLASFQIESKQLAQAHTQVANKVYSSASDTVSSGTLQLSVGGQTHDITVDSSNNTLEGLQKVINNGDYGVTASIINNGSGYQMMFTSKQTGLASEVSVSGLSDFDTDGLTTTANAQDAVMVLNGLTVTSSTNQFDEVIEGVSFQLNSASPGTPQSISIGQDSENIMDSVKSFVDVYNQLDTILDELGSYNTDDLTQAELDSEEYQYYGDLAGSSLLRSVRSQISEAMSGTIGELSGNYNSLATIGLSLNRDGSMSLDEETLSAVMNSNMSAVSSLFSKGGTSDDPLINVLSGNERTETGSYDLDITQLAERATVSGGAVTTTGDQKVAGSGLTDVNAALEIAAGASFDLTLGAGPTTTIDLSSIAGTYSTKEDVAAAIQAQIDVNSMNATIAYDTAQGRFEISSNTGEGALTLSNVSGLSNQGFSTTDYAGEDLIDLTSGASFDVSIDGSTSTSLSLAAGRYTLSELASGMTNSINSSTDVQAAGGSVSISTDGGILSISSNRYGSSSDVTLTNFSGLANGGLSADLTDVGQNVDGTITTSSGTLNIGAYADATDGRKVKISDFAVISGNDAEVRGLEFEVLGGVTGARGTITYAQGFASTVEETINNLFADDTGLISQRISSLTDKSSEYDDRATEIDAKYEQLLLKYQLQFSALQSILSSSEQTRDYLTATFSNNNNN